MASDAGDDGGLAMPDREVETVWDLITPYHSRLCRNWDFASFAPDWEQKTKVIMPILVYFCHYDTACRGRG
jgi:hypothetical protein